MRTSFELLEEGVRVEEATMIRGRVAGLSSYIISYAEFGRYLQAEKHREENRTQNTSDDLNIVRTVWGRGNAVKLPENTIEVKTTNGEELFIRQMLGGNSFPVIGIHATGEQVDTSRIIVDFKIRRADRVIRDVQASTFMGLMYGFHTEAQIVPNRFLTLKLKEDMEGIEVQDLSGIDTAKRLMVVTRVDRDRSVDGSFDAELARVIKTGGRINWGDVRC